MKRFRKTFAVTLAAITALAFSTLPSNVSYAAETIDDKATLVADTVSSESVIGAEATGIDEIAPVILETSASEDPDIRELADGGTMQVVSLNKNTLGIGYITETSYNSGKGQTYYFKMPADGMLAYTYAYGNDTYTSSALYTSSGAKVSYDDFSRSEDSSNGAVTYTYFYNVAKGNYKINIVGSNAPSNTLLQLQYAPAGGSLKSGKAFYGGAKKKGGTSYYKINVSKKGYLTVNLASVTGTTSYPSFTIQLLDKNKKKITGKEGVNSSNGWTTSFGVKKGTYYLAVAAKNTSGYTVKATAKAVSVSKYGTSKKKAVTLKKGKTAKGVIVAANKKTPGKQWYKVKLTKDQSFNLTVNTKSSQGGEKGKLTITFMNSQGSKKTDSFYYYNPKNTISYFTIGHGKKLTKGTYWICVSGTDYGNGYYTLKWK